VKTGTLYLVSTPIGNLGDITPRALEVLKSVSVIAAEDTRHSGQLLKHFGIETPMLSHHAHNEAASAAGIARDLRAGKDVAIISDAGTPLISDPGHRLVQAAIEAQAPIVPIPGANAILPALQLSGLPCHPFYFGGFLPPRSKARCDLFQSLLALPATLVFYEAPHRIAESLTDAAKVLDDRPAAVVREITKRFEEARRGTLHELAAHYQAEEARGEIVLVIAGAEKKIIWDEEMVQEALQRALQSGASFRDGVALVTADCGWPKKQVYDLALRTKDLHAKENAKEVP
jgi:16S rRNA (cytidine1402-2'-O)-methyltransferase